MPTILLSLLQNILPGVINRVLPPEKMSEEEAAKLQNELTTTLLQQNWQQIEAEYADRNSARGLAAQDIAKGNTLTGILAATVRPAWGYGALVLVAWSTWYGHPIAPALQDIIQTVLFFFFGGRTLEKITPAIVDAYKTKNQ